MENISTVPVAPIQCSALSGSRQDAQLETAAPLVSLIVPHSRLAEVLQPPLT